jgi:hypothetical protein
MIVTAIHDPRRLVRQAYASPNPGGWLEMADADGDLLPQEDAPRGPRCPRRGVHDQALV